MSPEDEVLIGGSEPLRFIRPDWPAPGAVRAAVTLRQGGVSKGPFASLNLGAHVGDDPPSVEQNRRRVIQALALPAEPLWLNQVHGTSVVIDAPKHAAPPAADASIAQGPGRVCAVLTADCLPVLFCDREGTRVAAAHAGWRGLAAGVLRATIDALAVAPARLLAWLGPAIEPEAFEVGDEVRERFLVLDREHAAAFVANERGRWQADLPRLAQRELQRAGVESIHGGGWRCYADSERFFSYRRESRTGRMATLVWLEPGANRS